MKLRYFGATQFYLIFFNQHDMDSYPDILSYFDEKITQITFKILLKDVELNICVLFLML